MRNIFLIGIFLINGCTSTPINKSSTELGSYVCPKYPGLIAGPFVRTEDSALTIAEAVISDLQSDEVREKYRLEISDAEKYWAVNQLPRGWSEDPIQDDGTLVISSGGGGISMLISKCDGAITQAHWIR